MNGYSSLEPKSYSILSSHCIRICAQTDDISVAPLLSAIFLMHNGFRQSLIQNAPSNFMGKILNSSMRAPGTKSDVERKPTNDEQYFPNGFLYGSSSIYYDPVGTSFLHLITSNAKQLPRPYHSRMDPDSVYPTTANFTHPLSSIFPSHFPLSSFQDLCKSQP